MIDQLLCAQQTLSENGIVPSELLNTSFSVVLNMVIYHSVPKWNVFKFFIRWGFYSIWKVISLPSATKFGIVTVNGRVP